MKCGVEVALGFGYKAMWVQGRITKSRKKTENERTHREEIKYEGHIS